MLALLLVAVSLGLSNFAAAGVSGVDARTRLRVAIVFGLAANYRHGRGHGRRAE
jgi:hypothetical protein